MTDRSRDADREVALEIHGFALHRLEGSEEFSSRRLAREISALRWLLRRSALEGGPSTLVQLSLDTEACARIFREPGHAGRPYTTFALGVFRDFLRARLPNEEAERRISAVEALLIPRPTVDWHRANRVPGGLPRTAGRAPLLLLAEDLLAIAEKAKEGRRGERAQRDFALLSLFCWSPLRAEEIGRLRWEDLTWEEPREGAPFGAWARCCRRRSVELLLPIHRRASDALATLHAMSKRIMDRRPEGEVFRSLRHPYLPLTYREAKQIFDGTLARIGLRARRQDLLAAYAYHLTLAYGYTIPDLREALGYSEVKHVSGLLETHLAWQANRKADEMGGPIPGW